MSPPIVDPSHTVPWNKGKLIGPKLPLKLKEVYQTAVQFRQGSALSLPFSDGEFDVVMMQHVAMQIAEKPQLFAELTRVVKQRDCLAMHELFAGAGEIHYPLAWASEPSMSSLAACRAWVAVARGSPCEAGSSIV